MTKSWSWFQRSIKNVSTFAEFKKRRKSQSLSQKRRYQRNQKPLWCLAWSKPNKREMQARLQQETLLKAPKRCPLAFKNQSFRLLRKEANREMLVLTLGTQGMEPSCLSWSLTFWRTRAANGARSYSLALKARDSKKASCQQRSSNQTKSSSIPLTEPQTLIGLSSSALLAKDVAYLWQLSTKNSIR